MYTKSVFTLAGAMACLGIVAGCTSSIITPPAPVWTLTPLVTPTVVATADIMYSDSANNLFEREAGFKVQTPSVLPAHYRGLDESLTHPAFLF